MAVFKVATSLEGHIFKSLERTLFSTVVWHLAFQSAIPEIRLSSLILPRLKLKN